ncbi:hypothetical protein [Nocardia sp. NPDC057440]|uniref:hypothetical protein n=1 Tax=Nocardia sp. NPDC057440 TaxID=3346134 RepID=UPI00366EB3D8
MPLQWTRSVDNFPSTLSGQWVRRNGGTNPLTSGGMITTNSTSGFFPAEFIARPSSGADQYIAVTIAQLHPGTSGGSPSCVVLRSPNNATTGTVPVLFIKNAQLGIFTMTSWAAAGIVTQSAYANANGGSNMAVGGRIEFWVTNNVYTTAYNGNVINTWDDSGTLTANQTGRYGAVIMQRASDGSATGQMGFDDCQFGDFAPTNVPMPMQAINRPNTY